MLIIRKFIFISL